MCGEIARLEQLDKRIQSQHQSSPSSKQDETFSNDRIILDSRLPTTSITQQSSLHQKDENPKASDPTPTATSSSFTHLSQPTQLSTRVAGPALQTQVHPQPKKKKNAFQFRMGFSSTGALLRRLKDEQPPQNSEHQDGTDVIDESAHHDEMPTTQTTSSSPQKRRREEMDVSGVDAQRNSSTENETPDRQSSADSLLPVIVPAFLQEFDRDAAALQRTQSTLAANTVKSPAEKTVQIFRDGGAGGGEGEKNTQLDRKVHQNTTSEELNGRDEIEDATAELDTSILNQPRHRRKA